MTFQIFSLRAVPGGHMDAEWGTLLDDTELHRLGINDLLRRRLTALAEGRPGPIPLLLPYQDRRMCRAWPVVQMRYEPRFDPATGAIVLGDPEDWAFAHFLPATLLRQRGNAPRADVPLAWQDRRVWDMRHVRIAFPALMRRHDMNPELPLFDGKVEAQWTLRFRSPGADAWTDVPSRRSAALLTQYRQVAHSLQKALRTWMPYRYFHNVEAFGSRDHALPYVVYSTMRPFYSRLKTQLTYHALEPSKIRRGLYRLDRPVARALDIAHRRLLAAGLPASAYRPDDATRILGGMYDGLPRLLGALVNQEAYIMEELIRFSDAVHDGQRESGDKGVSTGLVAAGRQLQHIVRCRMRRSLGGESYLELTPLVLLAITAGLARAQGRPAKIEAHLLLRELDSGREFSAQSEFWYASSGFDSTLSLHETDSDETGPVLDDDDADDGAHAGIGGGAGDDESRQEALCH